MKDLKIAALLIVLCLIGILITINYFPSKRKPAPIVHSYDYILEVSNPEGTELYTLYNEKHVLIADSLTCTQLDSVIVEDNR
jgi:hypothetical protein